MAGVKTVELHLEGLSDLALIDRESIWLVVPLRWWDLATLVWWLTCPSDKKATVKLTMVDGTTTKVKCVRVASKHIRVKVM